MGGNVFNRFDHIGVIVDDLEGARKFLGDVLGLPLVRTLSLPDRKLEALFFSFGNTDIEVIELGDTEERRRRLGDGVPARIEHIALTVDDVDAVAKELHARGVETQTPEPVNIGQSSRSIFTRPESCDGVTYQFLKRLAPAQAPQRTAQKSG